MLDVTGLCKSFGGFTAVSDVEFSLSKGEILGLIGPNGSGKSTIFNMLSGALRPNAGSVKLEGKEIAGLAPHLICEMGVGRTFQIPRPIRRLSILENAALAAFYGHPGEVSRAEAWRTALGAAYQERPRFGNGPARPAARPASEAPTSIAVRLRFYACNTRFTI